MEYPLLELSSLLSRQSHVGSPRVNASFKKLLDAAAGPGRRVGYPHLALVLIDFYPFLVERLGKACARAPEKDLRTRERWQRGDMDAQ